jgi:hypothetical protein
MCGIIPVSHWACRSVRISVMARGTEMRARPIAMKAASQDHWLGVQPGRSHHHRPEVVVLEDPGRLLDYPLVG